MERIDKQAIIEMLLYILEKTKGLTQYNLMKTLYFAHRCYLVSEGLPLVSDKFYALPHGPVPTQVYDWIKYNDSDLIHEIVIPKDAKKGILTAKRTANLDYIAPAERVALDKAIEQYAYRSFADLRQESHDSAWLKASITNSAMSNLDIARVAGAEDHKLERLETYMAICD